MMTFDDIRSTMQELLDSGQPVILQNGELNDSHSDMVYLTYVGPRWCMGYTFAVVNHKQVKIPHTINYSDYLVDHEGNQTGKRYERYIVKGANPFA